MAMCVKKQMINVPAVKAVPDTNRCISLSLFASSLWVNLFCVHICVCSECEYLTSRKDSRKVKGETKTKQYYAALETF